MSDTTALATPELSPAERFAAVDYARTLTYDGPRSVRWAIEYAGQVEGFPHSYPATEVEAAKGLLRAAAHECEVAEAHAAFLAVEAQRTH